MRVLLSVFLLSLMACSDDDSPRDAAIDAVSRPDVPSADVRSDTSLDSGTPTVDAGNDAGTDAGNDAGLDAGSDAGPDTGETCGPATPVGSLAELIAQLPDSYGWEPVLARRASTGELVTTSALRFSASDIPISSDCTGFCSMTWLSSEVGDRDGGIYSIPAGTRFRIRVALTEIPPLGEMATVYIQASCLAECSDLDRCPLDNGCYGAGLGICLLCLGGEPESCACVDDMQMPQPEGTMCNYVRGDTGDFGICQEGLCERPF